MEASGGLIPTKLNGDLVVLIGAGASSYLGLPGLNDLLQNPERGIGLKINDPVYTTMYRVWGIVESSRPGQANFEELITRLKTYYQTALLMREDDVFASHLGSVPHSVTTREFESVWWLALTACYRQLLDKFSPQCIDPNTAEFHVSIELLERLIRFNSLQAIHVYTTNYDCAPNLMASKAERLAFVSHIDNHSGHFRENWYSVRKDLGNADGRPLLYLHRLHGCVAWIADQNCPFHLREIYGAGGKLEIAHESDLHKICIKLTSSERIGTNPAFLLAFTEFAEHLRSCGLLLVWGYSFRDVEVSRHKPSPHVASFGPPDSVCGPIYV